MSGINSKFDKEYIDKGIEELAKAPVEALKGLSEADAQKLKEAFNIKTVKDLGTNKFFLWRTPSRNSRNSLSKLRATGPRQLPGPIVFADKRGPAPPCSLATRRAARRN
ncbi:hypothetical protein OVA06_14450 [Pseudarthrobacter sp. SL88]|uniref:hypothetical protein n=1 Tax=Pseudarthrobacter sp. SL88 TaxID=2994666 RepID=UPI002274BAA9|nr:hypothetical protein [Pseudarthrobacter sp. SL88]MCY1675890.1 hypothetical protein [Pseudarthrobacter sp. SL88]